MEALYKVLDALRDLVRRPLVKLAGLLNKISGGKLTPNTVTIVGVLGHIPIALLIAKGHFGYGAILLVIFGLFDTLDGSLARLQKRESSFGMLMDASTDRFKEVILYTGVAYNLVATGKPYFAVWAVAACGASLCVSYIKARGEAAVASSGKGLSSAQLNNLFKDGLFRFEVRMALLVIGLLTSSLNIVAVIVAIGAGITALDRLVKIGHKISN